MREKQSLRQLCELEIKSVDDMLPAELESMTGHFKVM